MNNRIEQLWSDYAAPRFSQQRAKALLSQLRGEVSLAYLRLADEAAAHGGRLTFMPDDLTLAVITGLDSACEYCGEFFGVESWGVVRRNPLVRPAGDYRHRAGDVVAKLQGSNLRTADFSLAAVAVCCRACAQGKRMFTDDQWLGLRSELRKCDEPVERAAVEALAEGGRRYFRHPRQLRVTREPRNSSSEIAKK